MTTALSPVTLTRLEGPPSTTASTRSCRARETGSACWASPTRCGCARCTTATVRTCRGTARMFLGKLDERTASRRHRHG